MAGVHPEDGDGEEGDHGQHHQQHTAEASETGPGQGAHGPLPHPIPDGSPEFKRRSDR